MAPFLGSIQRVHLEYKTKESYPCKSLLAWGPCGGGEAKPPPWSLSTASQDRPTPTSSETAGSSPSLFLPQELGRNQVRREQEDSFGKRRAKMKRREERGRGKTGKEMIRKEKRGGESTIYSTQRAQHCAGYPQGGWGEVGCGDSTKGTQVGGCSLPE